MTIEEIDVMIAEAFGRLGVVREQFGDRSVEYTDQSKVLDTLYRERARLTIANGTGTSMSNRAQYNGG